ncbi:MAG TPA: T9SS type A sorting domain-containing protein [Bacteroidales bacterium]|nr:T9SS type A sorting domain-containing protein [Bacteroidales bacterium]HPS50264.1 T9SS type A sorting domain-containing protein [Bacteroidales bacterium]
MKKLSLTLFLIICCALFTLGQHSKVSIQRQQPPDGYATKSEIITTPCSGLNNTPTNDLQWRPLLAPVRVIHRSTQDARIRQLKEQRMEIKMESEKHKGNEVENATQSVVPTIGSNFAGNGNSGFSPLDNSIAISNGGIIVSVANTTIEVDNTQGQNLYYKDLLSFINDPEIEGVCDPVIIYDSGSDRFIFFCQVSPLNSLKSKLLIYFSKSNNPLDGWWYYKLTGNPLNDYSAFDYPKLGLSTNELYICGNLYRDNGPYNQSVIYQIPKTPGYNGQNINWQYWKNISGNPFTITPLSWGQQGNYGPGCYFVASESGDGSMIKFYNLTDDMSSGSEKLEYYEVNVTPYQVAPNALQAGSGVKLNTNDCRMLSGFFLNGIAHFVFHSMREGGYAGINYNRLTVSSLTNQSNLFGLNGSDYCYPSVSSFGTDDTDQSVMIGFLKSNSSEYPSIRVVNCDQDMNWSSSTQVMAGSSYVYYTGDPERWGDYSGTCRKNNASRPTVWMSGMYGNASNYWDTWIAEIYGTASGLADNSNQNTRLKLIPNPVVDLFAIEFELQEPVELTITIIDATGKTVRDLYSGKGRQGKNHFSFNKSNLSPGAYFLILKTNNKIIKNEKLVIAG